MFNGKKIEEILAVVYETQVEIRETNNRLSKSKVKTLEEMVQSEKKFTILDNKLNELCNDITVIAQGFVNVIQNQEKLLEGQKQYIPLKRRKRKKALTQATGYTSISDAERASFLEMYNRGLSMTDISVATGRSSSAISNYIRSQVEGKNETTKA